MGKEIRILLVDDHQVVRDGLRTMLAEEADMEIVGQSAGGEEVLTQMAVDSPNVLLMDIKMPRMDGIQLAYLVKQKYPACAIVMLTLYDEYLAQAMKAGASGYLLKDITREELIQAIRQVHHGEVVISKSIIVKPQIVQEKQAVGMPETGSQRPTGNSDEFLKEIQLVIPPPVDANQLIRFTARVEEMLQPRVLQVLGSWHEGTAVIAVLPAAMPFDEITGKLKEILEIDTVKEEPLQQDSTSSLIKKALAIPSTKSRPRKTIIVTLKSGREQSVLYSANQNGKQTVTNPKTL